MRNYLLMLIISAHSILQTKYCCLQQIIQKKWEYNGKVHVLVKLLSNMEWCCNGSALNFLPTILIGIFCSSPHLSRQMLE